MSILLGSHVKIGTKKGTVRFIGETEFASGTWYGVELVQPVGKNNGSVNGKSYFVCGDNLGLFVKKSQIRLDRSANKASSSLKAKKEPGTSTSSPKLRPSSHTSRDKKVSHAPQASSKKLPPKPATTIATPTTGGSLSMSSPSNDYNVGDKIKIGTKKGTIRFIGETKFATGTWYGIELEQPAGKNDGSINGEAYFKCELKYGLFVKKPQIRRIKDWGIASNKNNNNSNNNNNNETGKKESAIKASKPSPQKETLTTPSTPASVLSTASSDNTPNASPLILPSPLPPSLPSGPPPLLSPKISTSMMEREEADKVNLNKKEVVDIVKESPQKQKVVSVPEIVPSPDKNTAASKKENFVPKEKYNEMTLLLEETIKRVEELESMHDDMKNKMLDKDSKIKALQTELVDVNDTNNKQDQQMKKEEESSISSLKIEIESLQRKLQQLEGEKREVETTVRKKNKDIAQLKSLILAESKKTETKMKDLEDKLIEAKSKHHKISNLHHKNSNQTSKKLEELENANLELEKVVSKKEKDVSRLKDLLKHNKAAAEANLEASRKDSEAIAAGEIAALKQALETARSEAKEHLDDANNKYKDLEERYTDLDENVQGIQNDSTKWQRQYEELRIKVEKDEAVKKKSIADIAKDKAAVAKAERIRVELEKEVEELNDMVEMLTLDKEQLVVEKDLAEEVSEDLQMDVERLEAEKETITLEFEQKLIEAMENNNNSTSGGSNKTSDDSSIKAISEQNSKLREALLRLRDSTSLEKNEMSKKIRLLEKDLEEISSTSRDSKQLEAKCKGLESEIIELKDMVDSAQAYESMVEELTDQNLELNDQVVEMKSTIEELEQLRDLSEEMDAQNAEISEQLQEEIRDKEREISEYKEKCKAQDLLAIGKDATISRFRQAIQSLKSELDNSNSTIQAMGENVEMKTTDQFLNYDSKLAIRNLEETAKELTIDVEMSKLASMVETRKFKAMKRLLPETTSMEHNEILSSYALLIDIDGKSCILRKQLQDRIESSFKTTSISFTETQTIFKIQTTLAEVEYYLHLLGDKFKSSSPEVINNVLSYSRKMLPPQKRLKSALDNILQSYRDEGAILVDGSNIDYYEQLYSSLNAWKSVWEKIIAANIETSNDGIANANYIVISEKNGDSANGNNAGYQLSWKRHHVDYLWLYFGAVIHWMVSLIDDDVGEESEKEKASKELESFLNKYEESSQDVQIILKQMTKLESAALNDVEVRKKIDGSMVPKLGVCLNTILNVASIFQSTQNMELAGKIDVILTSLPETFSAMIAEIQDLKALTASVTTLVALDETGVNSNENELVFEYEDPPILDQLASSLRSQILDASNLENEIQSLKTTLSKRIKEVYLKQREVDGCLLKIEKLQKQVEDNSSILETTKKEKLTVQADFEKEQSHFEEAMADFHKDIEKLEKDNRRLKRLVKKGGFGGADVMGSPSVAGSPMTPIGSSNAVTTSAISAASTFSNATLQNALQNSMKKSLHWRKLAMKSKLANLSHNDIIDKINFHDFAVEGKDEETKSNNRNFFDMVKRLDRLDSKVRKRQSTRRLVDLTNLDLSPSKQIEQSRAKDVVLISEYKKVKDEVLNFVDKNYYGVLKQTDFGEEKFINTGGAVKNLLFKP